MKCNFCKSELRTLSSLNYHKKNNKKCLEIQHNANFQTIIEKLQSDNEKLQSDNDKLQSDNEKLQFELKEMKVYLEKIEFENNIYKKDHETVTSIAKQPKITTKITNNYNNLSVYNDDVIKDRFTSAINNIKPSDLYDGQKSIGRFVAPCLQNDDGTKMITCSDFARNVFIVKDDEGNLNKDIKCRNLANIIEPIATAKVDELIKEDNDKRWKVNRLNILKKQLMNREMDIENLENHLLGLEKYSQKWCYVKEQIIQKEKENELDFEELEQLDEDNNNVVHHHHTHVINYDEKLAVAADDIKEMKKDSSKFSKTLSELV